MPFDANEFFRQATLRICGNLKLVDAIRDALRYLEPILPGDRMCMTVVENDVSTLHTVADVTRGGSVGPESLDPITPESRALLKQLKEARLAAVVINDPVHNPIVRDTFLFRDRPNSSMLAAPLQIQGEILGILTLSALKKNRFTEKHKDLFALLNEPFAVALSNALQHREVLELKDLLADDNRYLQRELRRHRGAEVVGAEHGLRQVMQAARHVAPRDSPVLLLGETGVGKDVVANAIHELSSRRGGPFIKVNCGAIPETLVDTELFGHERGAFTGAVSRVRGRFERANGGTIFLDEIGDLPLAAQVRLLRVLQFKEVERVGGRQSLKLDIRVLAATHRDLGEMVTEGRFRGDLLFRLDVFPIHIPPLRERPGDIPALVRHIITLQRRELKLADLPVLADGAMEQLLAYGWPGNVRELQNVLERALIRQPDAPLTFDELEGRGRPQPGPTPSTPTTTLTLDETLASYLRALLQQTDGRINGPQGAAALAGVHPSTLRGKLRRHKIPFGRGT